MHTELYTRENMETSLYFSPQGSKQLINLAQEFYDKIIPHITNMQGKKWVYLVLMAMSGHCPVTGCDL